MMPARRHLSIAVAALCLTALAFALAACRGDGGGNNDDPRNLLTNGGFESGTSGWTSPGQTADTSDEQGNPGSSAVVQIEAGEGSPASAAGGIFQDATVDQVPDLLSGDYFVDEWVRGTPVQYVEAVVILFGGGPGMPTCPGGGACPNIQMRYILTGVDTDPIFIENAHFSFLGPAEPVTGEWVHFEAAIAEDFALFFGSVPAQIDSLRLHFEVRYDSRSADDDPTQARIYADNLYFGPR